MVDVRWIQTLGTYVRNDCSNPQDVESMIHIIKELERQKIVEIEKKPCINGGCIYYYKFDLKRFIEAPHNDKE